MFSYQLTQASVTSRRANGSPFSISILQKSGAPHFQNSVKGPPLLFDFDVHRTQQRTKRGRPAQANVRWRPATSARFVFNGALRFHPAPGTYVANIHKTLLKRRAFFCFHRLITAGTPNDRRLIHTILHSPSPTGNRCLLRPKQISYLRFYRGALTCRTMRAPSAAISNLASGQAPLRKAHCRHVNPPLADFFEQLWCCCNTLTILKESPTAERIAGFATAHSTHRGLP